MAPKRKATATEEPLRRSKRLRIRQKETPPIELPKGTTSDRLKPLDPAGFQKPSGATKKEWTQMLSALSDDKLKRLCISLAIDLTKQARGGVIVDTFKSKMQMATAVGKGLERWVKDQPRPIPEQSTPQATARQSTTRKTSPSAVQQAIKQRSTSRSESPKDASTHDKNTRPLWTEEELHDKSPSQLFRRMLQYWKEKREEQNPQNSFKIETDYMGDLSTDMVAAAITAVTESPMLAKYHSFISESVWSTRAQALQSDPSGKVSGDDWTEGMRVLRPRRKLIMPWLANNIAQRRLQELEAQFEAQQLDAQSYVTQRAQFYNDTQQTAHIFLIVVDIPFEAWSEVQGLCVNNLSLPQISWYDSFVACAGSDGSTLRKLHLAEVKTVVRNLKWLSYLITDKDVSDKDKDGSDKDKDDSDKGPITWLADKNVSVPQQTERSCGLLTILNGWAAALDLQVNPDAFKKLRGNDDRRMFRERVILLANLAVSGNLDAATIFLFFRTYDYVEPGQRLKPELRFDQTRAFNNANAMQEYLLENISSDEFELMMLQSLEDSG